MLTLAPLNPRGVFRSRCLIPRFDGAILSQEWKEALRVHLADFKATYNFAVSGVPIPDQNRPEKLGAEQRLHFARRLKTLNGLTPSNTSAKSGFQSRTDLSSTRSTICRD